LLAVNIPKPNEYAKDHGHNPFPPRWERWLSSVREAILSAQPVAGRHVSVDEHPGKGTVVNVDDTSSRRPHGGGGGGTGACCNLDDFSCTDGVTRAACEASGGIYLGDDRICEETTCTCCPHLDPYTTITFGGKVIGCTDGDVTMPAQTWTKTIPAPGCNLDYPQWYNGSDCGCEFQAQNCFPFTEVGSLFIDENEGACADPFSHCSGCCFAANISCNNGEDNATVTFSGSTNSPCCDSSEDISNHGPYNITGGTIDVTVPSDSNPSIQYRFVITFA
jgi:hypothetical protein